MALAAILAAVDALPDAIKSEYRPASEAEVQANPALKDKFLLDVTPTEGFRLGNVDGLVAQVNKLNGDKTKLEGKVAKFGDLDPADVTAKLERLTTLESIDPAKEADKIAQAKVDAVKRDMTTQFDTERKELSGRADKYRGALDGVLRRGEAIKAITDAGGSTEALLPHVLGNLKFNETDDGKFSVQVVDHEGNPRVGDTAGNPMTLEQLVSEYKTKDAFAPLFQASGQTGGGGQGGGTGGKPPATGKKKSEMSLNERADYIEQHGQEAYLSLAS